jgi:hypothetical protein
MAIAESKNSFGVKFKLVAISIPNGLKEMTRTYDGKFDEMRPAFRYFPNFLELILKQS